MPKTRPTHAERWLASGYCYDDIGLWRELCTLLEARGLTPTAELPEHLAPLVYRDPENSYLRWLHEQVLAPVLHVRGHAREGGNGWRAHPDWRERLMVMQAPMPDALLNWGHALEARLHATHLTHDPEAHAQIYDRLDPRTLWREVMFSRYRCTICGGESWDDDARGIRHDWRRTGDRGDCLLIRLRRNIRAGELARHPQQRRADVISQLDDVSEHYLNLSFTYFNRAYDVRAAHHWQTTAESDGLWRIGWASAHIAELFGVWIVPTWQAGYPYVRYLRTAGKWPVGAGVEQAQHTVSEFYHAAALRLETLLTSLV